jgi:hypothetical protein
MESAAHPGVLVIAPVSVLYRILCARIILDCGFAAAAYPKFLEGERADSTLNAEANLPLA